MRFVRAYDAEVASLAQFLFERKKWISVCWSLLSYTRNQSDDDKVIVDNNDDDDADVKVFVVKLAWTNYIWITRKRIRIDPPSLFFVALADQNVNFKHIYQATVHFTDRVNCHV